MAAVLLGTSPQIEPPNQDGGGQKFVSSNGSEPSPQQALLGDTAPHAVNADVSTNDEAQRSKEDLEAQKQMASWAVWMGVFTGVQVLVSAAGILVVLKTLAQGCEALAKARDANSIAQRQFEAGYKPQLRVTIDGPFVHPSKIQRFAEGEPERCVCIHATVSIQNIGTSPATLFYSDVGADDVSPPPGGVGILHHSQGELFEVLAPQEFYRPIKIDEFSKTPDNPTGWGHAGSIRLTNTNLRHYRGSAGFRIKGIIRYGDPLGNTYELGFAFKPESIWRRGGASRCGGDALNYDRRIERRPEC